MNKDYITHVEFMDLLNRGIMYEGYVVGYGLAFKQAGFGYEYDSVQRLSFLQCLDTSEEEIKKSYSKLCEDIKEGLKQKTTIKGKDAVIVNVGKNRYYVGDQTTRVDCNIDAEGNVEISVSCKKDSYRFIGNIEKFYEDFLVSNHPSKTDVLVEILGIAQGSTSTAVSFMEESLTSELKMEISKAYAKFKVSGLNSPTFSSFWKDIKGTVSSSVKAFAANPLGALNTPQVQTSWMSANDFQRLWKDSSPAYLEGAVKDGKLDFRNKHKYISNAYEAHINSKVSSINKLHYGGTALNVLGTGFAAYDVYQVHTNSFSSIGDKIQADLNLGINVIVLVMPEFWWVGALWFGGNLLYSSLREDYYAAKGIDIRAEDEFNRKVDLYYGILQRQYREGGPRTYMLTPTRVYDKDGSNNNVPISARDATRTSVIYQAVEPYNEPDYRWYIYLPDGSKQLMDLPSKEDVKSMLRPKDPIPEYKQGKW